jgi:hypothetical protein
MMMALLRATASAYILAALRSALVMASVNQALGIGFPSTQKF